MTSLGSTAAPAAGLHARVVAARQALCAPPELSRAVGLQLGPGMCLANTVGALLVFGYLAWLLPVPKGENPGLRPEVVAHNAIVFGVYTSVALAVGTVISVRKFRPIDRWLKSGEPVTAAMQTYVVRHPLRQTLVHLGIWLAAEPVFVPLNLRYGRIEVTSTAVAILIGALTTCAVSYLLAERILRPVTGVALAGGLLGGADPFVPGVETRLGLAWLVGTAVPLSALLLVVTEPTQGGVSVGSVVFLAVVALVTGAVSMGFAARSVGLPVDAVTDALARVEDGDLDISVPVNDGSQVGRLQSGFNAMVAGLRERRELRDLFGRQVGEDVAAQALARGTRLGGEQMPAAVLFVDVIGSTTMAATMPADDVVATLNDFFAVVVDVIARHGGSVNKFEGDAALCIFGVPTASPTAETDALAAARELATRLDGLSHLTAAVGVSCGPVVAGNVGAAERFEYTVIGDAVNEAARLTDLAKGREPRVLASAATVAAASADERERWTAAGSEILRGRPQPTALAVPVG